MNQNQKLEIAEALIDIKLALNDYNRTIDKNNIDALNELDVIEYDRRRKGFAGVDKILKIIRSI